MKPFLRVVLAIMCVPTIGGLVRADDKDPKPILDKAIKALGGEEKLKKVGATSVKSKLILVINGNSNDVKTHATVQGLDHYRAEFEGEFGGNQITGRHHPQRQQRLAQVQRQ